MTTMTVAEKAKELWESMNTVERFGLIGGCYSIEQLRPNDIKGFDPTELALAFIDLASTIYLGES